VIHGGSVTITFRDVPVELIDVLFGGIVLGEVGYKAYGDSVGWKNYLGRPMPEWGELPEAIRGAWIAAAGAIVSAATRFYDEGTAAGWSGCSCGHLATMHDVEEASGEGPVCCVDGCGCGSGG
jgi:hypothetical protein